MLGQLQNQYEGNSFKRFLSRLTTGFKVTIIILFAAAMFGLYQLGVFNSLERLIAPKASSEKDISPEAKELVNQGVKIVRVGVVTWPGYVGGQFFNGGFRASKESRFYQKYKFLVDFKIIDDFEASRNAFKSGEIDLLWVTADAWPTETDALSEYKPKIVFQSDWSRGGDAIVATFDIKSVKDLKGKKVAVAIGTPSHSFLLLALKAAGMDYSDVEIVGQKSAIDAAAAFKSGAVTVAVVWAPDDQDCIRTIPGAHILTNTKEATNIIADCFFTSEKYMLENAELLTNLFEGWMIGAGEINNSAQAKEDAIRILVEGLNIDESMARASLDNVRLTNFGDNLNFFGLNPSYKGVTGENLYSKMGRIYADIKLISSTIPPWRNVSSADIIRKTLSLGHLQGSDQDAEGEYKFTKATEKERTSEELATKSATVTFASGSATLDENARVVIKMTFGDEVKFFKTKRVRIQGNTDNIGSDLVNERLSLRRAQAVAEFLTQEYGLDPNKFIVVGNGPSRPVASNDTEEGRRKNRRTDFQLLK